jgi:hypothetical protein
MGLSCYAGLPVSKKWRGGKATKNSGPERAKDMLSLSLLQARLIDLKLPIKIVEGE